MQPQNSPNKHLIQDIRAPSAAPRGNVVETEVMHNIPVKQQNHSAAAKSQNPIASSQQFVQDGADQKDTELDNILIDVNRNVGESDKSNNSRFKFFGRIKTLGKKSKPKATPKTQKPTLVIIIAIVVAAALLVAAFYAFVPSSNSAKVNTSPKTSATPGKVGTSAASSDAVQAAGGTLVQAGDLSDLSDTLQTKINGLNDVQDFNQTVLSDQSLGL